MRIGSSHPTASAPRRRGGLAAFGVVALSIVLLLVTGCNSTSGSTTANGTATPTGSASGTATATPNANATCATALPGAGTINLSPSLEYPIVFPNGTVGTAPSQIVSGTGLFTVYSFNACSPNTSVSGVNSFFASNLSALQHGWISQNTFPADGGLMQSCNAQCWYDPKGGPWAYLIFDQFSDQGNGVITYRGRYAVSPDFPNCNSNFTNGAPAVQFIFFLSGYSPALPLPPISSTAPDDASGGQKGFDICSPGDAASVTAFMEKELPATGWTKSSTGTTQDSCIFTSECWVNGSRAISFNVPGDATSWIIAWRQAV